MTITALFIVALHAAAGDRPTVEELWIRWKAGDEQAIAELCRLGPEARDLAHRILFPEGEVHPAAPKDDEWWLIGHMQADAVPELTRAIEETIPENYLRLIELLPDGPMSASAGDVLLRIAMDEGGKPREAALRKLALAHAKTDYVIPQLVQMAQQSAPNRSRQIGKLTGADHWASFAVGLLEECPDDRAYDALYHSATSHPEAEVRGRALPALVKTAGDSRYIYEYLIEALDDRGVYGSFWGSTVSDQALDCLLDFEELPPQAAVGLVERLYRASFEEDRWQPEDLCEAICRCPTTDEHAGELIQHKLSGLLEPDAYIRGDATRIRVAAASVVLKWNPEDRTAAEYLAQVLSDETGSAKYNSWHPKLGRPVDPRAQAARGFERLGAAAHEQLPLLNRVMNRELAQYPDSELAFATAWAIAHIDPDDEHCLRKLKSADEEWRSWRRVPWPVVERVLGKRVALLTDLNVVLPQLQDGEFFHSHAHEDDEWFWLKLKPHAETVVPAIVEHFQSDDVDLRLAAAEALRLMRSSPALAVPQLVERLSDERAVVRAAAARALGAYGPAAAEAAPALQRAAADDYLTVRFRAQEAVAAIEAVPRE